jgi:tetratricopeptide (TPR) repeat protein/predicted Ser/Thr protein kinase
MPDRDADASLNSLRRLDALCGQFEQEWRQGGAPRIDDYLPRVPPHDRSDLLLELLLQEWRARRQRQEPFDPEEYRTRFSGDHPAVERAWQQWVRWLEAADTVGEEDSQPDSPAPDHQPPVQLDGYEVLGVLGRGGMGVVYQARQVPLNRLVALKMILAGGHAHDEEKRRFLAEAEAIARVRHPGIVQVYDYGTHEGLPFFSLEYCEGGSLADRLAGTPMPPVEAAALVEQLARAVDAAHAAGIIHRDLKPANVLMTHDGTPKITDFGLAKRVEGAGQTQTGALVGTPSYMAPEQAEGRKDVGPPVDVYALGAILYEGLTGRPPFKASNVPETLLQVVAQEPVPPRQLNAQVPRDLETVCLKCLRKEPARRYARAVDLAEDLRRWQAGEPIRARPVSRAERVLKWVRRQPVVAGLLGVIVLGVVLAFVVLRYEQVRTARQRDETREALSRALDAEKEASDNLAYARQAVDECFGIAREDPDLQGEHLQKVRQVLLGKTLPFYRRFTSKRRDDPELAATHADYLVRIALITEAIGSKTEALQELEQALDVIARIRAAQPDDAELQASQAEVFLNLGSVQHDTGKSREALHNLTQARDLLSQLTTDRPDSTRYQDLLAHALSILGHVHRELGNPRQALECTSRARDLFQKRSGLSPDPGGHGVSLASTWNTLGRIHREMGNLPQALASYEEARNLLTRLNKARPGSASGAVQLGAVWNNIGRIQAETSKHREAITSFEQARDIQERLTLMYPTVTRYQADLARTYNNLALAYQYAKRTARALTNYEQARGVQTRLCQSHPEAVQFHVDLGGTIVNIASLLRVTGQYQEALGPLAEGLQVLRSTYRRVPDHATCRTFLRNAHWQRAMCLSSLRRYREALADWEETVRLSSNPGERNYCRVRRAETRVRTGDYHRAMEEMEQVVQEKMLDGPSLFDGACVVALSAAAISRDPTCPLPQRERTAETWARLAVGLLRRAEGIGHFKARKRLEELNKDSDLDFLRSRADFRQLRRDLARQG